MREEEEVNLLKCSREEDGSRPAVLAQSGKAESSHSPKTEKPHDTRSGMDNLPLIAVGLASRTAHE